MAQAISVKTETGNIFRNALLIFAVAAAYYFSARLGLMLAFEKSNATAIWAPSGIALAVLLLFGYRIGYGIFLGAFLANVSVFVYNDAASFSTALWVSFFISAGNTSSALFGYYILKNFKLKTGEQIPDIFHSSANVIKFSLAALAMCVVSSSAGSASLLLGNIISWENVRTVWFTWWMGDVAGILLFTPLIIAWRYFWRNAMKPQKIAEVAVLFLTIIIFSEIIFGLPETPEFAFPRKFLLIPLFFWAALRFELRELTIVILLVAAIIVWKTVQMQQLISDKMLNDSLLIMQQFIAINSITFLTLSALLYERKKADSELKQANEELSASIVEKTGKLTLTGRHLELFQQRSNELMEYVLKIVNLDFSKKIPLSDQSDELDAIAAGLNIMSEELEEQLKKTNESEKKFRGLLESAPDAMVIVDKNGIIRMVNAQTEKMFLYEKSEIIGKKVEILIPERFSHMHPAHRKEYFEHPKVRGMGIGLDLFGKKKNGQEFPVEISLSPMETSEGILVSAAIRDITERKQKEEKIRENQQFIEHLMDVSPDFIGVQDIVEGKAVYTNKNAKDFHGFSENNPYNLAIVRQAIHPDDLPQVGEFGKNYAHLKNGEVADIEFRMKDKNGNWRWMLSSAVVLKRDEKGIPRQILTVSRDTTERKKIEKALYESELKFRKIVEEVGDVVYTTNYKGFFVFINSACLKLTGYTQEEILGKHFTELVAPAWKENVTQFYFNQFKNKEPETVYSFPIITKDRTQKWIEQKVSQISEGDRIIEHQCVVRDITERKKIEDQLKENEEQIRTIFQNAPEAVILINKDSVISEWNPMAEKIFGWSKEEVLGKYLYHLIIPERYRQSHINGLDNYLRTGEQKVLNRPLELPALRKDHSEFDAGINISPILFRGKLFFIGFITDITSRKKSEVQLKKTADELARSNTELEQFAYVASHDLQEPLRMISSYVQLLEKRYKDKLDADANDFIHFAVDGSNRMRKLINSLLEYSRINRKKPFELIKTNSMLLEVLRDIKDVIKENQAEIHINKLPDIIADPVLISQVFQNLISNAIKFKSEQPPRITISGEKQNGEVLFSVKDNGIGIKKEYFDKIFVIFQRLHNKDEYPGTGIGLAICKKIVERHGGKIWVESEVGRGSFFYFTLKKIKPENSAKQQGN